MAVKIKFTEDAEKVIRKACYKMDCDARKAVMVAMNLLEMSLEGKLFTKDENGNLDKIFEFDD